MPGSSVTGSASESSGSGYQVSRTVPSRATVARPTPIARVGAGALGVLIADQPNERAPRVAAVSADADLTHLDLHGDPVDLTAALVDVPSVSGEEKVLADAVETALRREPHLEVVRSGEAVLARTTLGRGRRVLLAGHLDTVPIADNVPSHRDGDLLFGCGTSDMKAGVAVMAHLTAAIREPAHDVTLVLYDCEEVEASRNGLGRIERDLREWLDADLAILGEPTSGLVEGGCQGTLRLVVDLHGRRAHSARSWLGENAIHAAGAGAGAAGVVRGARPSTSTAVSTGRGCRRCGSAAGSRATSSRTPRR